MKISVAEAMRLEKEVSSRVRELSSEVSFSDFGTTKEDGQVVEESQEGSKFTDLMPKLKLAMQINLTLNDTLAKFGTESEVSSLVRQRQNFIALIGLYETALKNSKPRSTTKFENLKDERISIKVKFEPFVSSKELKSTIKELKAKVRNLQTQIDTLNLTALELNISEEDLSSIDL